MEPGTAIITVDRTKPFNPAQFINHRWTIAEEDECSPAFGELDLSDVYLATCLEWDERHIAGEEKLRRLKEAGHIRLDAKVLQTLWENQHVIPESWKRKADGARLFIFFDGTVLQHPSGSRCVLCLYWQSGAWYWGINWLGLDWRADNPSAVLKGSRSNGSGATIDASTCGHQEAWEARNLC